MDMGNAQIMFNGPVPGPGPVDQRVLIAATGDSKYCYACGDTGRDNRKLITKDRLIMSFEEKAWVPIDGSVYVFRMLRTMTPLNSVACVMHGPCRSTPPILAIITYHLIGALPPRLGHGSAGVATRRHV